MPRRLWLAGAVVAVLALVVGGVVWLRRGEQSSFAWAVAHAPAGTQRASWTDWAAVRRHEGAGLSSRSSAADLHHFLSRSFDDDLSSTSALVQSAPTLQQRFGFSPADADWELFSQSDQGAVVMVHLPAAVLDAVPGRLRALGYQEPSDPGGVWSGGSDLVARISPDLTPELSYLAIDTQDSVILASDTSAFLTVALDAVGGRGARVSGLGAVVADAGEPLSSAVYSGDYACAALAMAHAGASDQAAARRLLAAAGEVNPYSAFAMSDEPDGSVRVALEFDGSETARTNADTRAVLARGPAPGQGGTFGERFTVDSVTAHGSLVVMRLAPRRGAYVLSDLSTGPVLFATC
ncbi:hypothetical protein [Nocardioides cynanchi]|uniref:hypothetical protein n=1 Tax=Nocardioides cynanchi TaxID=2558918 RepID=UPI00124507F8|nr:hypothetical protein [Nocardioides cynanchi]